MPLRYRIVTLQNVRMKKAEDDFKYISSSIKTFIRITSKLKYFIRNIILIINHIK